MKMPVVITSQTIFGRIDMNVYAPGRELNGMGVLGNYCDMTPECAFIKLAYLLSHYEKEEVKALFAQNLRGEISERSDSQRSYL
jgi:glutamyl-tRNA(Gln) amidotransferase subunit D